LLRERTNLFTKNPSYQEKRKPLAHPRPLEGAGAPPKKLALLVVR
jgi:hypothetical protein